MGQEVCVCKPGWFSFFKLIQLYIGSSFVFGGKPARLLLISPIIQYSNTPDARPCVSASQSLHCPPLPVRDHNGASAALFEVDFSTGEVTVDNLLIEVADGEQVHVAVVAYLEFVAKEVDYFLEAVAGIVDANGKTNGRVLHQVYLDMVLIEDAKEAVEFFFGNKRKIFGGKREEDLVGFINQKRHQVVALLADMYDGSG